MLHGSQLPNTHIFHVMKEPLMEDPVKVDVDIPSKFFWTGVNNFVSYTH